MLPSLLLLANLFHSVVAINFEFEAIQLTEEETIDYPSIRFGNSSSPSPPEECKYIPGDREWPSDAEWVRLNKTLGGALLQPLPLAVVCYNGPLYDATKCAVLRRTWTSMAQQYVFNLEYPKI